MSKKPNVLLGMGPEPQFEDPSCFEDDNLRAAFTWYNYRYDLSDAIKWLTDYLRSTSTDAETIALYERNWRYVPQWVCVIARLANRSIVIPPHIRIRWRERLNQLESHWQAKVATDENVAVGEQSNLDRRIGECIAEIEHELDRLYQDDYNRKPPDFYAILNKFQIKGRFTQRIIDYYQPLLDEIEAKIDERLSRAQYKVYKAFVQAIIDDCNRLSENAKAARKPRKKKAKKQNFSKCKYAVEDLELKLRSIDLTKVVGALTVYVYNRRRRKLHMLVAASVEGLKINRSTIINIDEKMSSSKTIRNPAKTVVQIAGETKKGTVAAMFITGIKAKQGPASGRLSEDSLILKAFNT